jgi:hypothetical protein
MAAGLVAVAFARETHWTQRQRAAVEALPSNNTGGAARGALRAKPLGAEPTSQQLPPPAALPQAAATPCACFPCGSTVSKRWKQGSCAAPTSACSASEGADGCFGNCTPPTSGGSGSADEKSECDCATRTCRGWREQTAALWPAWRAREPVQIAWQWATRLPSERVACGDLPAPCMWTTEQKHGRVELLELEMLDLPKPHRRIMMSLEGEKIYPLLSLSKSNRERNGFVAMSTTSFQSEIPVPYFSFREYDIRKPRGAATKNQFRSLQKRALFLASNCRSRNGREQLVLALIRGGVPVDSPSSCLQNTQLPSDELRDKGKLMRKYPLYFSFENQCSSDYITEKLWGALAAGGPVPVYFGAPNVAEHVPRGSIIDANGFESLEALALHLSAVLKNETLFESYHHWRREPLPTWFLRKFNFTRVHSKCRACKWAWATRHGKGWDRQAQRPVEGGGGRGGLPGLSLEEEAAGAVGLNATSALRGWLKALEPTAVR